MQLQAFEGFWENGNFYSAGQPIRIKGRQRAILTLLDEPERKINVTSADSRIEWLNMLDEALKFSMDEELPDFPSRQAMREPHGLTD